MAMGFGRVRMKKRNARKQNCGFFSNCCMKRTYGPSNSPPKPQPPGLLLGRPRYEGRPGKKPWRLRRGGNNPLKAVVSFVRTEQEVLRRGVYVGGSVWQPAEGASPVDAYTDGGCGDALRLAVRADRAPTSTPRGKFPGKIAAGKILKSETYSGTLASPATEDRATQECDSSAGWSPRGDTVRYRSFLRKNSGERNDTDRGALRCKAKNSGVWGRAPA